MVIVEEIVARNVNEDILVPNPRVTNRVFDVGSFRKQIPELTSGLCFPQFELLLNNRFFSKYGKYSLHVLFVIIIAIFWGVSISMYLNIFPVPPYDSGTEFMLNSWVFVGLNNTENTATVDMLATFVFIAYPVWLLLGMLLGQKIFKHD